MRHIILWILNKLEVFYFSNDYSVGTSILGLVYLISTRYKMQIEPTRIILITANNISECE